jgi:hypothetical protein
MTYIERSQWVGCAFGRSLATSQNVSEKQRTPLICLPYRTGTHPDSPVSGRAPPGLRAWTCLVSPPLPRLTLPQPALPGLPRHVAPERATPEPGHIKPCLPRQTMPCRATCLALPCKALPYPASTGRQVGQWGAPQLRSRRLWFGLARRRDGVKSMVDAPRFAAGLSALLECGLVMNASSLGSVHSTQGIANTSKTARQSAPLMAPPSRPIWREKTRLPLRSTSPWSPPWRILRRPRAELCDTGAHHAPPAR